MAKKIEQDAQTAYYLNKMYPSQAYIHRTSKGYGKHLGKANPEKLKQEGMLNYKVQSNRLKNNFKERSGMRKGEATKAYKALEGTFKGMQKMSEYVSAAQSNLFLDPKYSIDGDSFYGFSLSAKKREALFKDADKLAEFVKKLDEAVTAFVELSPLPRKEIEQEVRRQKVRIADGKLFDALGNIYSDGKADKGVKALVAASYLLKSYSGMLPKGETTGVPVPDDAEAAETIRRLAGALNGLKGGFFEVAVNQLLNNAGEEFFDGLKKIKGVTISGSGMSGESQVSYKAADGSVVKTTSKTDLKVKASFGKNNAEFEVGLSLKTNPLKSYRGKEGLTRKTTIHTGNLGRLMERAMAMNSDSTYFMLNEATHGSTRSALYRAARIKLSSELAFDALAGLGNSADTSYFILYADKVVSMVDYLTSISKAKNSPFGINIAGIGDAASAAKKLKKGRGNIARYNRSREAFNIFMGLKVVLTSETHS